MLLSIATTGPRADSLGHLLHKHPDKFQSFDLSFGKAHVFYPEAGIERAEAALLLEVDSVGLARGKNADQNFLLGQYVNDRPYAATSFLAVAIARVFGSALNGKCAHRPDLATAPRAYEARVESLPARGGEKSVREIFAPLGYEIEVAGRTIDERFPEWGASPYVTVTLRKTTTLRELLTHLYVLIPTFDARKHYYVGADELEKLLAKGEGWLAGHPAKETIARRYLRFQPSLFRMALARLVEVETDEPEGEEGDECSPAAAAEE
ncbi:MAG TPA: 3' terminal RNA ribose 2'-O-methyltransferase Hen1, partial [Planctomycetia bacterium]|nr:3' terminal RNA ribose 2'-O-methyltransferase Hen1 [Planctomycetia bacterium]